MKEVEVKARVGNLDELERKLKNLDIKFSSAIRQEDIVYSTGDWEFTKFANDRNILRIRQQGREVIFTLKRPGKNELDSIEREVTVNDASEMKEILKYLGYQEEVRVSKLRRRAKYRDMEICLDRVDGLGDFIEIEKLTDEPDTEAVQAELFALLEEWGISHTDRETHGYDTLIAMKKRS